MIGEVGFGADNIISVLVGNQDLNARDAYGRTAISYAASQNNNGVVAKLINLGADAEAEDNIGYRPVHYAAMANNYKVIRTLADAGVNVQIGISKKHDSSHLTFERKAGETAAHSANEFADGSVNITEERRSGHVDREVLSC